MLFKKIYSLGDKFEDKVRGHLSHYPIIYAFIGGAGIIIFWRGVWHSVDYLMARYFTIDGGFSSPSFGNLPWWDGPASVVIGITLLLTVGLFVTSFIGNEVIISGLKREKKLCEKTEDEVELDLKENELIKQEIHEMDKKLNVIEKILKK